MFVAVTRLRLRSLRFLLPFVYHARRSRAQAERAAGCVGVYVRKTQGLAFWTLSCWEDEAGLRRYLTQPPHRVAMPKLAQWCDEAAVAHWVQDGTERPDWDYAAEYLRKHGRLPRVRRPSELQEQGVVSVA